MCLLHEAAGREAEVVTLRALCWTVSTVGAAGAGGSASLVHLCIPSALFWHVGAPFVDAQLIFLSKYISSGEKQ